MFYKWFSHRALSTAFVSTLARLWWTFFNSLRKPVTSDSNSWFFTFKIVISLVHAHLLVPSAISLCSSSSAMRALSTTRRDKASSLRWIFDSWYTRSNSDSRSEIFCWSRGTPSSSRYTIESAESTSCGSVLNWDFRGVEVVDDIFDVVILWVCLFALSTAAGTRWDVCIWSWVDPGFSVLPWPGCVWVAAWAFWPRGWSSVCTASAVALIDRLCGVREGRSMSPGVNTGEARGVMMGGFICHPRHTQTAQYHRRMSCSIDQ